MKAGESSGLNWDWNAALQQDDKYVVTVVNGKDGVISGTGDATTLDGDGVDVDYIVNLTNSGTIIAKDSFGSADGLASGGGVVTNTGTIGFQFQHERPGLRHSGG
ncbi:MAG: hypothetical protein ACLT8E_00515 [Akkermansia sp.]